MNELDARLLMRELFSGYEPHITDEIVAEVIAQANYKLFTAIEDGRVVAMASLYTVRLFSRHLAIIEEVVTLPDYRNRGHGSGLVNAAIAEAERCGVDCIELTVREDSQEIQQFYGGLGFKDRNQRVMRRKCAAK